MRNERQLIGFLASIVFSAANHVPAGWLLLAIIKGSLSGAVAMTTLFCALAPSSRDKAIQQATAKGSILQTK